MVKGVCVDEARESREVLAGLIRKINGVRLTKVYSSLETATRFCCENRVDVLYIRLYRYPLPQKRVSLLKKIAQCGTLIIVLSSRIGLAHESHDLNAVDFLMLPTSASRLCKATSKALEIAGHASIAPVRIKVH